MYRFLEHTADFKFQIEEESLEDIFRESLNAINDFINPEIDKESDIEEVVILLEKTKFPDLLIDFLSEALSLIYVKKRIFTLKEIHINEKLKAILEGKKYKSLQKEIKAITYHQAKLEKVGDKYIAEFIVDV